jgi:hypothetical protein
MVKCHQDIKKYYKWCSGHEVQGLWQFARDYAASVCKQVRDACYYNYFPPGWCVRIEDSRGWKECSPFVGFLFQNKTFDTPDPSRIPIGNENELQAFLDELDRTRRAINKLRHDGVLDHQVDLSLVGSQEILQDIDTTDSYDTEDGDDKQYATLWNRLKAFHNDETSSLLRIGPVLQSRMRKDIEAWTRIAKYACIRLPGDTMLIHKEWVQRLRRHRKKRNTNLDGGEPQEEAKIMCQYCPKRFKSKNEMLRHENSFHLPPSSWSCATLLRIEAAFYSISSTNTDVCGYCGGVFLNPLRNGRYARSI